MQKDGTRSLKSHPIPNLIPNRSSNTTIRTNAQSKRGKPENTQYKHNQLA